jgi:hypothetical protein
MFKKKNPFVNTNPSTLSTENTPKTFLLSPRGQNKISILSPEIKNDYKPAEIIEAKPFMGMKRMDSI